LFCTLFDESIPLLENSLLKVVEKDILLVFLGELMDLGKRLFVYCKRDGAHSI
jgi:hypothetical protein